MKNTHIQNLDEVIPADIRLQTYKEALEYYEQRKWDVEEDSEGDYGTGLCLVLPCIMWSLYNYISSAPVGYDFHWPHTQKAFPELGRDIDKIYEVSHNQKEDKNIIRMKILRNWIKELSDD